MSDSLHAAHALTLAVLRANPRALHSFLEGAATSVSLVNSLLRVPARTEAAFRDKLERVLQEVMSLCHDANELRLEAVGDCARRFESALTELRQRPVLTGDDFLPLAVRLDELFTQIAAARSLDEQRSSVNPAPPTRRNAKLADALLPEGALRQDNTPRTPAMVSEAALQGLATRVAGECGCRVALVLMGLELVPTAYRKSIDNMLVHLVRNAIEHGIEPFAQRLAIGKPEQGIVTVEFNAHDNGSYQLMIQDDGQGFDLERIGRVAVQSGLLTDASLAGTDPRKLVGLIFRPGFSTAGVDGSSGRGLGMEFLRELVTRLDGNITVSTKRGRYTRFRVTLPPLAQNHSRVA
ncbi:MAG: ATP-binding protein [Steroidobacteraceae bacterium]